MSVPDKLCIITYLSQYYNHFSRCQPGYLTLFSNNNNNNNLIYKAPYGHNFRGTEVSNTRSMAMSFWYIF